MARFRENNLSDLGDDLGDIIGEEKELEMENFLIKEMWINCNNEMMKS